MGEEGERERGGGVDVNNASYMLCILGKYLILGNINFVCA